MGGICAWWTSWAVVWMLGWVVGDARGVGSRRVTGTGFDAEVGGPAVVSEYSWPVPTGTYNLWENGSMSAALKAVSHGRYMVCVGAAAMDGPAQMEVKVEGLVVFDGLVVNENLVNVYCGEGPSLDENARAVSVLVSFKNDLYDPPVDRNLLVVYAETVRIRKNLFAADFGNETGSSGDPGEEQGTWIFRANGAISNFLVLGKHASRVCFEMKGTTATTVWPLVTISSFPALGATEVQHFLGSVFWTNWRNVCVDMRGFQGTRRIFRISFSNEGEARALCVRRLFILGKIARLAATPAPKLPASCTWSSYFRSDISKVPRVGRYAVSPYSGSIFYIKEIGTPAAEDRRRAAIFKISRLNDGSLGNPRRISPISFSLSVDYSEANVRYDAAIVEEFGQNDEKLYLRRRRESTGPQRYETADEWVLFDVRAGNFVKLAEYKLFGLVFYAAKENTDGDLLVAWGKLSTFLSAREYFKIDKISPEAQATLFTSEATFSSMDVASDGSLAIVVDSKKVFMIPRTSQLGNVELKKFEIAQGPLPASGVVSTSVRVFAEKKIIVLTVLLANGIQIWTTPWIGDGWEKLGKTEYISVPRREGGEINGGELIWIPSSTALRGSVLYTAYATSIVFQRNRELLTLSKTYVLSYNLSSLSDRNWYDLEFFDSLEDHLVEESLRSAEGLSTFAIDDQLFIRHPDANDDVFRLSC